MARRLRHFRHLGPVLLLVWAARPAPTLAQDDPMIVEVHLHGIARDLVEAPVLGGEPGVPVRLVLDRLEVAYETEDDGRTIKGHLGGRGRPFEIHGTERIVHREHAHVLEPDEAAWFEGELFLAPRIFRDVLDVDLRYEPSRLALNLRRDTRLPAYRRLQMERARRYRDPYEDALDPAATILEATTLPYGGHVLDWNVTTWNMLRPRDFGQTTWSAAYGGDVFGGALRAATSGSVGRPLGAVGHLSWSRPWDLPALRETRFGTVVSPGPARRSLLGVVVTNAPIYPHQRYGQVDLPLTLEPHTPVDLFLDGAFLDHYETGPAGLYEGQIPLRYGHNRLELRYLDPYGELRIERLLLRVPRGMLREGDVQYHAATGRDRFDPTLGLTTLQAGWGATRWLSVLGGSEVVMGAAAHRPGVYPYATGLLRVDGRTHLHVSGALGSHLGAGVDFASPSMVRIVASHREYAHHPVLQPSTFRRETALQTSVPFRIQSLPVGLNLQAREVHHRGGDRATSLRTLLLLRTPVAGHFVTGYDWRGDLFGWSRQEGLLLLRWSRPLPRQYVGGAVRLGLEVEPHQRYVRGLSLAWGRHFWGSRGMRVEAGYLLDRDPFAGYRHEASVSIRGHFDGATVTSGLTVPSSGPPQLQSQATGSVTWSEEAGVFSVHRLPQIDRGRLLLRLEGQPVEAGSYAFLVDGRRYPVDANGAAVVPTLVRERTYRVFVESTSRADPLLSPRYEEIDVRARANRTLVVDIPVDENFELSGRLYTEPAPGVRRGLGLARVDLVDEATGRTRTLRTFQDGALYDFGIPPGDWRIVPDATQMHLRGLVARPASIRVVHRPEDGIAVHDHVEFLAGPPEAMTDAALAARIWAALLAGEREAAFSISRVLVRDTQGDAILRVAQMCAPLEAEDVDRLRDGLVHLPAVFVLPNGKTPDCVELGVAAEGGGTNLAAEAELEMLLGELFPGAFSPLRAVVAEELLERRY
jgi:hypothetical protein